MQPIVPVHEKKSGVYQGPPIHSDPQSAPPVNLIRTMKSDAETAIKNQNETAVSIALAEQKKREDAQRAVLAVEAAKIAAQTQKTPPQTPGSPMSPAPLPKAPKKIGRFVFLLTVLMILSVLGMAYIFLLPQLGRVNLPSVSLPSFPKESKLSSTSTPVVPKRDEVVASSTSATPSEKRFNIAGATLAQITSMVASEKSKGTLAGSLKNLIFTEGEGATIISASRLLSFTNAQAPDMLMRSLDNKITVGFFGETNGGATPFIILKVTAHDTSLAGMLDWENSLPLYFDTFFGTTIKKDPRSLLKFHDLVILKKDTRVLDVPFGGTLGYAFANQNTIVIAGSRTALEALLPLAEKN